MFKVSTVAKTGETANPNARKRNGIKANPIILDMSSHALSRCCDQEITVKFTQLAAVKSVALYWPAGCPDTVKEYGDPDGKGGVENTGLPRQPEPENTTRGLPLLVPDMLKG